MRNLSADNKLQESEYKANPGFLCFNFCVTSAHGLPPSILVPRYKH